MDANPPRQFVVLQTTNLANITTKEHKVTTNAIYMNLDDYPLILLVTTNGNKPKTTQ